MTCHTRKPKFPLTERKPYDRDITTVKKKWFVLRVRRVADATATSVRLT